MKSFKNVVMEDTELSSKIKQLINDPSSKDHTDNELTNVQSDALSNNILNGEKEEDDGNVLNMAADKAEESLVICQCAETSLFSLLRINEISCIESYTIAKSVEDKKIVIEDFKETAHNTFEKIKKILLKIRDSAIDFFHKIVFFIKKTFSRVYVKLVKVLAEKSIKKEIDRWEMVTQNTKVDVPECFLATKNIPDAYLKAGEDATNQDSMEAVLKNFKDPIENKVNVNISNVFPRFNNALDYIKSGFEADLKIFTDMDAKNKKDYNDAEKEIANKKEKIAGTNNEEISEYRKATRFGFFVSRKASNAILKKLRFTATCMTKVLKASGFYLYNPNPNEAGN